MPHVRIYMRTQVSTNANLHAITHDTSILCVCVCVCVCVRRVCVCLQAPRHIIHVPTYNTCTCYHVVVMVLCCYDS